MVTTSGLTREVRNTRLRLMNKYADFRYGTPSERRAYEKIEKLIEWAMTYNGRNA